MFSFGAKKAYAKQETARSVANQRDYDMLFKLLLIGSSGSGKVSCFSLFRAFFFFFFAQLSR